MRVLTAVTLLPCYKEMVSMTVISQRGRNMVFAISDEVQHKEGGQTMVVTGHASGMVECRWYDGYAVRNEAFRTDELSHSSESQPQFTS
jgi:uncharacterized protein YodC (DUF2158 family)